MESVTSGGAAGLGYPDSADSSPRSRGAESWDEPFPSSAAVAAASKFRLMCSFDGQIVPRPTDKSLCYLGGETRMVVVERHASLAEFSARLSRSLLGGRPFTLKYQLPNEDLDSLISVTTDEDLENMIEEYDRIAASNPSGGSTRSSRLRLFLFPSKPESTSSSINSLLDDSKSETWFVDALNAAGIDGFPRGLSADAASVNCLLGLEDDSSVHSRGGIVPSAPAPAPAEHEQLLPRPDSSGKLNRQGQDVHSVPDSPMLDTTSSFGSASSAPSLSNLPPIRVRPIDRPPDHRIAGLDDHFANMNISAAAAAAAAAAAPGSGGVQEAGFAPHPPASPPILNPTGSASTPSISPTENPSSRVFSSDEDKSDHGGARMPPPAVAPQQKPYPVDVPISDSVTRPIYYQDRYTTATVNAVNPVSYQKPELPVPDPSYRGYVLPQMQQEQMQQQQLQQQQQQQLQQQQHQHHQQQQQLHQQQQQQQHHQQQQFIHQQHHQQQQFIHPNHHYMDGATGALLPIPPYYQMPLQIQQPQQSHAYDPQIPMYFMPVQPNRPYNLTTVQPNLGDAAAAGIPNSAGKPVTALPKFPAKPELPPNMYRTAASATSPALQPSPAAPLIHVAADQAHPYGGMGYHMMQQQQHHPSQPPAAMANYGYDYADPSHPQQAYYTQTASQALPPQYQAMINAATVIQDAGTAPQNRAP